MNYTLRPATESDIDFLLDLRRRTMNHYLTQNGVDASDTQHLYRIQYQFEDAQIIVCDGQDIGLFKASYLEDRQLWYVYQLQVVPAYQGKGIGRRLLVTLCDRAKASGLGVGLSVLKGNPAKKLYDRLMFEVVEETASEYEMRYCFNT